MDKASTIYYGKEFRPYGENWVLIGLRDYVPLKSLQSILRENGQNVSESIPKETLVKAVMKIYRKTNNDGKAKIEKYVYASRHARNQTKNDPFLKRINSFFTYIANNDIYNIKVNPSIATQVIKNLSVRNTDDFTAFRGELEANVCKNNTDHKYFNILFENWFMQDYGITTEDYTKPKKLVINTKKALILKDFQEELVGIFTSDPSQNTNNTHCNDSNSNNPFDNLDENPFDNLDENPFDNLDENTSDKPNKNQSDDFDKENSNENSKNKNDKNKDKQSEKEGESEKREEIEESQDEKGENKKDNNKKDNNKNGEGEEEGNNENKNKGENKEKENQENKNNDNNDNNENQGEEQEEENQSKDNQKNNNQQKCPKCNSENLKQDFNETSDSIEIYLICQDCGWKQLIRKYPKPRSIEDKIKQALIQDGNIIELGMFVGFTPDEILTRIDKVNMKISGQADMINALGYAMYTNNPENPTNWSRNGDDWELVLSEKVAKSIDKYLNSDDKPMLYWRAIYTFQHEFLHIFNDAPPALLATEWDEAYVPLIHTIFLRHESGALNPILLTDIAEEFFNRMHMKKSPEDQQRMYNPQTFKYFDQFTVFYSVNPEKFMEFIRNVFQKHMTSEEIQTEIYKVYRIWSM